MNKLIDCRNTIEYGYEMFFIKRYFHTIKKKNKSKNMIRIQINTFGR